MDRHFGIEQVRRYVGLWKRREYGSDGTQPIPRAPRRSRVKSAEGGAPGWWVIVSAVFINSSALLAINKHCFLLWGRGMDRRGCRESNED